MPLLKYINKKALVYPFSYYIHQSVFARLAYRAQAFRRKIGIQSNLHGANDLFYSYHMDYLTAVNDCCEYLNISLETFNSYLSKQQSMIEELWHSQGENPSTFYGSLFDEYGIANICANCVCAFSLKYSYDVIFNFLDFYRNRHGSIRACDYGCANGSISLAMLLRDKLATLTLCDFDGESAKLVRYRLNKYGLENRAAWMDVRALAPRAEAEYDVVICFDVLEHVVNPTEVLTTRLYPMLKKGGVLILQAPWGGQTTHLDEAIVDFYGSNGGRRFLSRYFGRIYMMTPMDISGIWLKK